MSLDWERLNRLFHEALALPEAEREEFLRDETGEDVVLFDEVTALLAAAGETIDGQDDFDPLIAFGRESEEEAETGTLLGRYRLLEVLGEGGMGRVYRAEETGRVQRTVALKHIKLGLDTRQIIARFKLEQRALAGMNHPYIARMYHADVDERGRPYFVMEYVPGAPLDEWCDQNQLGIRQRLVLFTKVCSAVQHAHQRGVIHRDLKPANILVTRVDGEPVPKIIDFGVAKAVESDAAVSLVSTRMQPTRGGDLTQVGMAIGTLRYMSPEQTALTEADLDTRTDVYSLGVILYELLVGGSPYEDETFSRVSLDRALALVRENQPPKPSTRLSRMGALQKVVVANRNATAVELRRLFKGELDWIVMKAVAKAREMRYASAAEFEADITRFLNHRPVLARPPSWFYLARKLMARHRLFVVSAGLILLSLVFGVVGITVYAVKAQRAAAKSQLTLNMLRELLSAPAPDNAGADLRVRDLLSNVSARLASETETPADVRATVYDTLGATYLSLGMFDQALAGIDAALAIGGEQAGPGHPDTLSLRHNRARVLFGQGKFEEAKSSFASVLEVRRRVLGPDHPDTMETENQLANCYSQLGFRDEAAGMFEKIYRQRRRVLGPNHLQTLNSLNNLALVMDLRGEYQAAAKLHQETLAGRQALLGEDHHLTLASKSNLVSIYLRLERLDDAEALNSQVIEARSRKLGEHHPDTFNSLIRHGNILILQQRFEEARPLFDDLVQRLDKQMGEAHPLTLKAMNNLTYVLSSLGQDEAAVQLIRKVLALNSKTYGKAHRRTLRTQSNLVYFLMKTGRFEEAERLGRDVLVKVDEVMGADHPVALNARRNLVSILVKQQRWLEAESMAESIMNRYESNGKWTEAPAEVAQHLVTISRALGKVDRADHYQQMLQRLTAPSAEAANP